jgi:hypothetical protein
MFANTGLVEEVKEMRAPQIETAFGYPRDFLGNRFVYVVISPPARAAFPSAVT